MPEVFLEHDLGPATVRSRFTDLSQPDLGSDLVGNLRANTIREQIRAGTEDRHVHGMERETHLPDGAPPLIKHRDTCGDSKFGLISRGSTINDFAPLPEDSTVAPPGVPSSLLTPAMQSMVRRARHG